MDKNDVKYWGDKERIMRAIKIRKKNEKKR
jgi:hypothetical protein